MNLLLINYEYPPIGGGAANATWHIARELTRLGHSVTVLTSCYNHLKGFKNEDGISVYRCKSLRKNKETSNMLEMLIFMLSSSVIISRIFKNKKIDGIICFFTFPCGPLGLFAKLFWGIPYIISMRGGDVPGADPKIKLIHTVLRPLRRLIMRKGHNIIANSDGIKRMAQSTDSFPMIVIPNGVDTGVFYPDVESRDKTDQPFHFIYVGRFQPEKNLPFMFKYLAAIRERTSIPFFVNMVGDGPQKAELMRLADSVGIKTRIKWYGWVAKEELRRIYNRSDCLIMPSLYEGMSNAILEAMACGLPVIASSVGGNIDLVQHGKNGFLFDIAHPEQFDEAIMHMLQPRKENSHMPEEYFLYEYNWRSIAEKYLLCFE
jgi:glycosyltransferase involved in cell wall biosynthesis